jgi:tetratricopeptide (TPR) repeat protein
MSARSLVLGMLLTATPMLFAAAPPLGPDRPLTAEECRVLIGQHQRAFAQYQSANKAGRLKEAIEAAKEIVAVRERLFGARVEPLAVWLEWIGRQSRAVGADEQALTYATRAYQLRQRLHPQGDWRVVDARWLLEETRSHAKRDEVARRQLQRADQLNGQAIRLWEQGKAKEALPLAQEALTIRRQLLGEKHRDHAESLNNLACFYKEMGEHARARPLAEQSLALYKEAFGEKHPQYATSLNNLARLYQEKG